MVVFATVSAVVASTAASIGLSLLYMSRSPRCIETKVYNDKGYNDYVILLHGLGQMPRDLRRLRKHLCDEDYCVITVGYPSNTHRSIYIAETLLPNTLEGFLNNKKRKVNFVTYSLGGIILRTFLRRFPQTKNLGRIVMISPPNHGSIIASFFSKFKLIRKVVGPALEELSEDENSFTSSLPQNLSYDLGIIAGDLACSLKNEKIFPDLPHTDGCVTVESAQLNGAKDFITLPQLHFYMARSRNVFSYVSNFLHSGDFHKHII